MNEESLTLTEVAKLQHEVDYLKVRLENIEKFKTYFFEAKTDLILSKERVSCLENELVLSKAKKIILYGDDGVESNESTNVISNDSIVEFIKKSLLVTGYKELVVSMFRSMDDLGLTIIVKIHDERGNYIYSSRKEDKENNIEITGKYKEQGEFVETLPNQLILNLENISVLITSVPDKTSDSYEKIKAFSMMVFMTANLRLASLKKEVVLEELRKNLYHVFRKTHVAFEHTQDSIDRQVIEVSEMMLNFEKNLKSSLSQMTLPESYADILLMLFHSTKSDLNLLLTSSLCVDEGFLKAITKLENAYGGKYSGSILEEK